MVVVAFFLLAACCAGAGLLTAEWLAEDHYSWRFFLLGVLFTYVYALAVIGICKWILC